MMSFRPTKALQIWNRTRQWGHDSWRLGQVLWSSLLQNALNNKHSNPAAVSAITSIQPRNDRQHRRELVLKLATEESNLVARKWLSLEREWHMIQYHGISEYCTREIKEWWKNTRCNSGSLFPRLLWFSSSSTSSSTSQEPLNSKGTNTSTTGTNHSSSTGSNCNSNNDDDRKKAQIAFMITSSMRQELLGDSYRYDTEQIKHMTPIEASLILQHGIRSQEYPVRMPLVKQEYYTRLHEEQQKAKDEAAAVEAQRQQQQQAELLLAKFQQQQQPQQQPSSSEPTLEEDPQPSSSSSLEPSADENDDHEPSHRRGQKWYQIVEYPHSNNNNNNNNNESRVVAMYKELKEAQFGREVHQDLANRRRHNDHTSKSTYTEENSINKNDDGNGTPVSRFEIQTVYKE
jgi:hypothetical protein